MRTLKVNLENCYGIRKLQQDFDFSKYCTCAIYAPNGAMKSSLAQTFKDVADGVASRDRMFPDRECTRVITDENGAELPRENVFVIRPYDDGDIGHTEKTSTLLVDGKLREEYENLHIDIDKTKEALLKALKKQSGSKKDLEREISSIFTEQDDCFFEALILVKNEVLGQGGAPFADVKYDMLFDQGALELLQMPDIKAAIEDYIRKYNQLLAASTFFRRGIFNYYNATSIAKSLADNGFFDAKHTVNLNGDEKLEIESQAQLDDLIAKEKKGISSDIELRKKFAEVEKQIQKNRSLREFEAYLSDHEELLPELADVDQFRRKVWVSYLAAQSSLFEDLVAKYQASEKRRREIEQEARNQQTQWESVIEIFNSRFFVPFRLAAKNRIPVILGQEPMLNLAFIFDDGIDQAPVEKSALMEALSTGEKRAFYLLNIIFEVEARKRAKQETLFIIDDIADSFDYRNKYAIIQYLKDIAEEPYFKQIILTHNFDFFRTIESRGPVHYSQCLMAVKGSNGILLEPANFIKNIFVNDWKAKFDDDPRKRIASIAFIRNLIEYTKGENDPDFLKLTSLLHWKRDTANISQKSLDAIYNRVFGANKAWPDGSRSVLADILDEAEKCLTDSNGINLEDKIVLSIAIRIIAERFMVERINDPQSVANIRPNQTSRLVEKYKARFSEDTGNIQILERVLLMTPENIHLNSFMYEPLIDMCDEHLRVLYEDVKRLK